MDQKFVCKDFDEYFLNLNKSGFRQEKGPAIQNRLIDGVAMVPIKSYCEALGAEVTWKNGTEYISCPEEKLTPNRDRDFLPYYLQMLKLPQSTHLTPIQPAEQAMPQEIRELREEIYDVSDFKTAIDRIVLRFGYPDGLPPRWEVAGGTLWTGNNGDILFQNGEGCWRLNRMLSTLADLLLSRFDIFTVDGMRIGSLLLKKDGSFLFAAKESAAFDNPSGVEDCFFQQHWKGYWKIRFQNGYGFDTELYGLPLGQDAASVVFLCEDGSSREMTVSREEEYLNCLVFSSGALGCRMLPKSIENIFVDREFY